MRVCCYCGNGSLTSCYLKSPRNPGTKCEDSQEHRTTGRGSRVLRKIDDHEKRSVGRVRLSLIRVSGYLRATLESKDKREREKNSVVLRMNLIPHLTRPHRSATEKDKSSKAKKTS